MIARTNPRGSLGAALALAIWGLMAIESWAGPEVPGAPQQRPIALVGGIVHPLASGSNAAETIENATVVFDGGRIVAVGREVAIPDDAQRVDVRGLHVYPGLIDAYTQLGLVEIPSVRGSVDSSEVGRINPNVRAHIAVNPESELIPVTRRNGVLTVLTAPRGSLVAGISSLVMLDGWTTADLLLKPEVAMHIAWPQIAQTHTSRLDDDHAGKLETRDRTLRELRETLDDARAYWTAQQGRRAKGQSALDRDVRWEAFGPVFEGQLPLLVQADEVQQIQGAVALAEREKVKLIIYGGYDAPECAELLKQHQVPVIVAGVTRLPQRRQDPYDAAYTVPARLHAAGVQFCLAGVSRMGNTRNLPYQAGMAAAYGLPHDAALKSITLWPAEILGASDRIGSLVAGKDATLIVATGDVLETPTRVTQAYIQGRAVELTDRQTRLWDKYDEKYRRQRAAEDAK
ncbi:MAG TPA: imidazolonepropionase [Pirellulales bacterium]|jgi:imidazolonepropionase-like amidohydrolase|nr:imidazolonepropionase [Pirellulales bacterium]